MQDHNAAVLSPTASILAVECKEVLAVVGDDRTLLLLSSREQVGVGQSSGTSSLSGIAFGVEDLAC